MAVVVGIYLNHRRVRRHVFYIFLMVFWLDDKGIVQFASQFVGIAHCNCYGFLSRFYLNRFNTLDNPYEGVC